MRKNKSPQGSKDEEFERFFGIESKEVVYNNRYNDEYYRYEPTSYSGLICAFDELSEVITKYDRLVDFGCGKGRVLFYVNQRFDCEVCGIEIDEAIYEQALDNRSYYNARFKNSGKKIEIRNGKAEEYQVQREDTFFYFFNPFDIEIYKQVIANIKASVEEQPRKIYIIMYYPKEDYRKLLRYEGFEMFRIIKLPEYDKDWDEKVVVYCYGHSAL